VLRNSTDQYGLAARLFHWTTAAAFIAAYVVVYYVIWIIADNKNPEYVRTLNIHWALGLLVGFLVVPRLVWKWLNVQPDEVPGSRVERLMARVAHISLYALMIVLPITGYLGTRHGTSFGLFEIPSFGETALFGWIASTWNLTFKEFEAPLDIVHHFLGKWVAWPIVLLHIVAAFFHHWVRRDTTLTRMLGSLDTLKARVARHLPPPPTGYVG
jgi:cytochrome b561